MLKKKYLVLLLSTMSVFCKLDGQTIQDRLDSIYKKYDSIPNITFGVRYTYGTDTSYGSFDRDVLEGEYSMNGKKSVFKLGDIEYMQNDSFFIAVYNNDKIMIVADPKKANSGGYLPFRQELDSMIQAYSAHYSIAHVVADSVSYIRFEGIDSLAQFDKFQIEYDSDTKFIYSMVYARFTVSLPDAYLETASDTRNTILRIDFFNYHYGHFPDEEYDENNYLFVEDGKYKPRSKYEGFRFFNNKVYTR